MALNPYLFFDGNCREAFEFYRSVFGGDFMFMQTFGDAPSDLNLPEADKDRIMHVSLPVESGVLMGSDSMSGMGAPPTMGDNISLSVNGESVDHCDELMARLSEGGTIKMPMEKTFWGAYFGTCTDRFGIGWMINHELTDA